MEATAYECRALEEIELWKSRAPRKKLPLKAHAKALPVMDVPAPLVAGWSMRRTWP